MQSGKVLKKNAVLSAVVTALSFFLFGMAQTAHSRIIIVDANGTGEYPTIQAAINDANDGDIIELLPGAYTGDGNRDIEYLGKAITVRSTNPNDPNIVAETIIDCNGSASEHHRGFYFHGSEGPNSVLSGLTINNGLAKYGGGIYCHNGSPKISLCVIFGNSASYGGGVHVQSSSVTIIDCTIRENSAGGLGGGIYYRYSNSIATHCTINGNSADQGGGIFTYTSTITISNCFIKDNLAVQGGGIYIDPRAIQTTITNCIISGNWAEDRGGAIRSWKSSPIVRECIISRNSAGERGGGLFFDNKTTPNVINCLITANSADYGGGIYCFFENRAKFSHCTISGNFAEYEGGAIFAGSSKPVMNHSILWGNAAPNGPEIAVKRIFSSRASRLKVSYSDVQGGEANAYVCDNCTLDWGNGNIDVDPYFVELGYRADANDPNTLVEPNDPNAVWIDGDYHLLADSTCIDAGDPNYVPGPNETDLDGNPRVVDGDGDGIAVVDMGAYEAASPYVSCCFGVNHLKMDAAHLKCKGITLLEVTSDQGVFVYEPDPGKDKLKKETIVDDGVNGSVKIHTSGSKPLEIGDVFGAYTVTKVEKLFDTKPKKKKKGDDIEIKGTFAPAEPVDLSADEVTYIIDDGRGHTLDFTVPAGLFRPDGKKHKDQKFKFKSPRGSYPELDARFDFAKCKFDFKVKRIYNLRDLTGRTFTVALFAGMNLGEETVQVKLKGHHLEHKKRPKPDCCRE